MTDNERNETRGSKPLYGEAMKTVQTNLPIDVYDLAKRKAEVAGQKLGAYLRGLIIHALN